ncbi:CBS domain-containing protein [Neptunomonas phycophila]|jgi:CBS domain-containing protein|uniref:CBS domain-containing protein n=1 Tax=Neptunomonas phycophila TaxID=1572645 RepID=UPI000948F45D|nr:CBS domain-containing protein [Neptunomonas phycophila]QLE97906.1 CBS domain-containing protein [Neptunomonas phycophila]
MLKDFRQVRLQDIADVSEVVTPKIVSEQITLASPAEKVMTDFNRVMPITASKNMQVDNALQLMKTQHVRLLLATNDQGEFVGIITAREILGRNVMAYMKSNDIPREDVLIKHVMIAKSRLKALTMEQARQVKIGDVMETLKGSGEQHVLVVDNATSTKKICGIVSASDISRQLKVGFDVLYEAKSFADIEQIVTHGRTI